jgi:small GTP-binding protein
VNGVIIVFDVTNQESFDNVKRWIQEISKYSSDGIVKILVGNKTDLANIRVISKDQGEKMAEEIDAMYFETSAKSGSNISQVFEESLRRMLTK